MRLLLLSLLMSMLSMITVLSAQDSTQVDKREAVGTPIPKPIPVQRSDKSTFDMVKDAFSSGNKSKEGTAEPTSIKDEPDLEWGKVDWEYLKMKRYEKDTSANEILLLNYTKIDRAFYEGQYGVFYDYHYRVKIVDKSKYQGGEIELLSNMKDRLVNVKAQTINWVDGAVEHIKVKEILTDEQGEGRTLYRFSFPEIKDGSVLEYKYRIFSSNPVLIENIFLQSVIPIAWTELRLFEMNELEYKVILLGNVDFFYIGKTNIEGNEIHDGGKEYRWVIKDVKAVPTEDYTLSIKNNLARMAIQLHSYTVQSKKDYIFKDWDDYSKAYYLDGDAMAQVFDSKNISKIKKALKLPLATSTTPKEQMIAIYNYFRDNITWSGDHNIYISSDLRTVLKYKNGTSADINYLLIAGLRSVGINAYPILISTRENGRLYRDYPLVKQFEHVIVQAEIGNEIYRFDAIYKDVPYNLMPFPNLNYEGFLIKDGKGKWVDMTSETAHKTVQAVMEVSGEGVMSGTFEYVRDSYRAFDVRQDIIEEGKEKYESVYFEAFYADSKVTNLTFENEKDFEKELVERMNFSSSSACQVAGDLIYFNALLGLGFSESMFRESQRFSPVELSYPLVDDYTFTVKIPDGYDAEELPAELHINLPNDAAVFDFTIDKVDNLITYNARLQMKKVFYEVVDFEALKHFMDQVVEKQTSQIVLKKRL